MRIHEITTIKPIKPLNPEQARIAELKRQIDQGKERLKREKETQRLAREREAQRKARQRRMG